jgi:hypothetical protein
MAARLAMLVDAHRRERLTGPRWPCRRATAAPSAALGGPLLATGRLRAPHDPSAVTDVVADHDEVRPLGAFVAVQLSRGVRRSPHGAWTVRSRRAFMAAHMGTTSRVPQSG